VAPELVGTVIAVMTALVGAVIAVMTALAQQLRQQHWRWRDWLQ
jgi:ABC-type spermidine/putrescine transport system permease subunit II